MCHTERYSYMVFPPLDCTQLNHLWLNPIPLVAESGWAGEVDRRIHEIAPPPPHHWSRATWAAISSCHRVPSSTRSPPELAHRTTCPAVMRAVAGWFPSIPFPKTLVDGLNPIWLVDERIAIERKLISVLTRLDSLIRLHPRRCSHHATMPVSCLPLLHCAHRIVESNWIGWIRVVPASPGTRAAHPLHPRPARPRGAISVGERGEAEVHSFRWFSLPARFCFVEKLMRGLEINVLLWFKKVQIHENSWFLTFFCTVHWQ
jgi:hypothetical protein